VEGPGIASIPTAAELAARRPGPSRR
jgi:hypothetical protein